MKGLVLPEKRDKVAHHKLAPVVGDDAVSVSVCLCAAESATRSCRLCISVTVASEGKVCGRLNGVRTNSESLTRVADYASP
jgi:hypothetical protein